MHARSTRRRLATLLAVSLAAAPAALAAQQRPPAESHAPLPHAHTEPAGAPKLVLLEGLGDWSHPVSTRVPVAQRWFDQGLRLSYGFNHDESVRSFTEAARLDPTCAMCWWGVAYALSPNINLPMDAAAERRAAAAVREARARLATATPRERAYIDAMALRVAEPAGEKRAARDSAYAKAMREVARRWPDDADAQVLYADAMLNLRPWNQWKRDGSPQPGTTEVVSTLERTLRTVPTHAGGCHLYVHAVEASRAPERALPCAERLPRLMPGAGHVVHMPAHVYLRVGRYADAARANVAAVESDRRYFAGGVRPAGMYPSFYHPHNLHFLWATYLLTGQRAKAREVSNALVARVSVAEARTNASLEGFLPAVILTHARFGDWDAVLASPAPDASLGFTRGMWHYARGLARAGRGEMALARAELDSVRAAQRAAPPSTIILINPAPDVLGVATEVLAAEVARREKRLDVAEKHLREAVRREAALTYDEPPPWYHATNHRLGLLLLERGRPADAEAAFRAELLDLPENGWSLAGLERALRAQGKSAEADRVAARQHTAWKEADVKP